MGTQIRYLIGRCAFPPMDLYVIEYLSTEGHTVSVRWQVREKGTEIFLQGGHMGTSILDCAVDAFTKNPGFIHVDENR